jgi:hypothetical protein
VQILQNPLSGLSPPGTSIAQAYEQQAAGETGELQERTELFFNKKYLNLQDIFNAARRNDVWVAWQTRENHPVHRKSHVQHFFNVIGQFGHALIAIGYKSKVY